MFSDSGIHKISRLTNNNSSKHAARLKRSSTDILKYVFTFNSYNSSITSKNRMMTTDTDTGAKYSGVQWM